MTRFAEYLPDSSDPADVIDGFCAWAERSGRPLYAHQEEAALALAEGQHVVLATPTGSGKSLVAMAGIALALARNQRAVWTAPIKALVSEKFFDLVDEFGAARVGLATGDAAINTDAPILVCTAEVFANQALRQGDATGIGFACLDEFHYYGEHDRGWAWQVPLLVLKRCQFLLASATLGDTTAITTDLERRTGVPVAEVTTATRPTPLHHAYRMTPVAESVMEAVRLGLAPVYVVHTTQADAIERAQSLSSLPLTTRPQRDEIAAALKGVRFAPGFGRTLERLVRLGIGVHHAGVLPRYRRLVEKLAGEGLLPVICGTDTLGVGINVPIRTVLLCALTKFDGSKVRTYTAREFHQLAGRAGRPGFDPDGHVWAQAPDHVIENDRALARAGDDPKARRKVSRSQPPKGFVHYDDKTLERLVSSRPEPLRSRFRVTADLVASVLARPDGVSLLKQLLLDNHDGPQARRRHVRRAIAVFRSLEAAGVAERLRDEHGRCTGVRMGDEVGTDLRLSSPLAPFAIEVIGAFDELAADYTIDVVSVVESTLDDPMAILLAQRNAARTAELNRLKAEGVEYEDRLNALDAITWPMPLAELLAACFATYHGHHPWIEDAPHPKGIVREMVEGGETFASYVARYRIERSEGLLLRYLSDAWRALDRSLPAERYTGELEDVVDWLGGLIRGVDASLLEEWERLGLPESQRPDAHERAAPVGPAAVPKAWRTAVRTAAFGWVQLLARKAYAPLAAATGWPPERLAAAMAPYWQDYDQIGIDADARSSRWFELREGPQTWQVRQQLADPEGSGDVGFLAEVDLAAAHEEGAPRLVLVALGRFGEEQTAG